MHEAFWEKRSCRSFEMAETDFFSAALRQIHPRGGRGARSVVFEPRRKTIYPASLGRGRETGRGRVVSRCFLADEDRRFISTGIGGRLGAPYLPPLRRCEPPSRGPDADNITFSCPFYGYCHASAALIRPGEHAPLLLSLFSSFR